MLTVYARTSLSASCTGVPSARVTPAAHVTVDALTTKVQTRARGNPATLSKHFGCSVFFFFLLKVNY